MLIIDDNIRTLILYCQAFLIKMIDIFHKPAYNTHKGEDGDSNSHLKVTVSWRQWESGMSKMRTNITPEPRAERQKPVGCDGFPPLRGTHMLVWRKWVVQREFRPVKAAFVPCVNGMGGRLFLSHVLWRCSGDDKSLGDWQPFGQVKRSERRKYHVGINAGFYQNGARDFSLLDGAKVLWKAAWIKQREWTIPVSGRADNSQQPDGYPSFLGQKHKGYRIAL